MSCRLFANRPLFYIPGNQKQTIGEYHDSHVRSSSGAGLFYLEEGVRRF